MRAKSSTVEASSRACKGLASTPTQNRRPPHARLHSGQKKLSQAVLAD